MAGILLFETKDRNASHKKLEEILASGKYPKAECREDMGKMIFTVWSDAQDQFTLPPEELKITRLNIRFTEEEMDDLATRIAKKLKGE